MVLNKDFCQYGTDTYFYMSGISLIKLNKFKQYDS